MCLASLFVQGLPQPSRISNNCRFSLACSSHSSNNTSSFAAAFPYLKQLSTYQQRVISTEGGAFCRRSGETCFCTPGLIPTHTIAVVCFTSSS
jgi:hypothetical protein